MVWSGSFTSGSPPPRGILRSCPRHSDMNRLFSIFFLIVVAAFAIPDTLFPSGAARPAPPPGTRALTIQEAVSIALSRAPEVLIAEAQAIRSGEAVRETRALYHPQVYTGTGLAVNNGYPLSMEGAAPSIFQVTASQSLLSKKNSNLIREAEQSGKASRYAAENARNEVALRTALVYYQLHQSRKVIELASGRLENAIKQQEKVETLLSAGRVRPVELTIARTAALSNRQQLLVAQEQEKLAETELRQLTGIDADVFGTVEPVVENPLFGSSGDSWYQRALEGSPEILQSEANVKAKEFHVEAERGEKLPQAEIIGQYALFSRANNYQDYFNRFERNNFVLGLSIQVPIYSGARISSRVAQSRHEVAEARYRLESQKSGLKLSIERALSDLRVARGAAELARSNAEAAREIVEVNEALLEGGRISPSDMEDFRSQLQQKEMAQLEADQILFRRKLELLHAAGFLSSALQ